ncbi:MAG: chloride channel protein [Chitinophagales bacterium]|nr:chloride channel protein [Chitinophagales bacterium]
MKRNNIVFYHYLRLVLLSFITAIICSTLAYSLQYITEVFEEKIHSFILSKHTLLYIITPTIGITFIYYLRKYLFNNRPNKGFTEIYKTLDERKNHLSFFKIASHYINGFLTVIFGGSTGIEVSTVIATASVGNNIYKRLYIARKYKREIVCAGVASGIAILFGSPLAGCLFALEVIARKLRKSLIVSCAVSVFVSWVFIHTFGHEPILHVQVSQWKWSAIPHFIVLSLLGGLLAIYFTQIVIRLKKIFSTIQQPFIRVNLGAITLGLLLLVFPYLYGDSYHGMNEVLNSDISQSQISWNLVLLLIFLKPMAASLTLGAGGDGGVFAPSIVSGAFLGYLFAWVCNAFFHSQLVPVNFALAGAAATLSAAIYAPLTALVLVCNLTPEGYHLFVPIAIVSLIAKYFSKAIVPYNVYTYDTQSAS